MCNESYEIATPDPASLMQSLRAFGYDIATAIADLIDNSITAKASEISIQFEWNQGDPWIAIKDNGCGMTERELFEAMKLGSSNPLDHRHESDLGRFGLGLKTASFSQCRRLTVITKSKSGNIFARCWDLDIVNESHTWKLLKKGSETANQLSKELYKNRDMGTIVLWEKVDRMVTDKTIDDEEYQKAFLNYAKLIKQHVAVVFSQYMLGQKKITFRINENKIERWDPFMLDNSFTTHMPEENLYINGCEVRIKSFILPHQSKLTSDEFIKNAGRGGWNEQQGFYVYRNNRLMVMGNWLLPELEKKDQYRLARIRIDIGNETDNEWAIDVRKSVAVPPISIQNEIKRIAIAAQRESSRIYRHRGKIIARGATKEKSYVWHQNVRSGKLGYSINRNHPIVKSLLLTDSNKKVRNLLSLIEETIPVPMIISDYSEKADNMLNPFEGKGLNEFDDMIDELYKMYTTNGCSSKEAITNIATTEPYIYSPEKIQVYCEREGISFV